MQRQERFSSTRLARGYPILHIISSYQRQLATVRLAVSNSSMRLLRFVKRALILLVLTAFIFVAGISVYLRIEQYKFRKQAERLLSDLRELQLKKASAVEVKVVLTMWGFKEWGEDPDQPGHPCNDDTCLYRFELVPNSRQGHLADGRKVTISMQCVKHPSNTRVRRAARENR